MSSTRAVELAAPDVEVCRAILAEGSKSFHAASRILPRRVRDPAAVFYAFCRVADDAVDQREHPEQAVDELRVRLDRIYADAPGDDAIDRALASVVQHHQLPRTLFDALLEGFAWDASGRRYEQLDDVLAYCARVASTIGAVMTLLMGVRAPQTIARACEMGAAMQLTNIARDVGEDAARDRLYLPRAWLDEAGLDPQAFLADPRFDARVGRVVARLLGAARELYAQADAGVPGLPRDCRASIRAARLIYADIGRVIGQAAHDSITRRAHVSRWRKLWLVFRAHWPLVPRTSASAPPHPAFAFLVEAVEDRAPSMNRHVGLSSVSLPLAEPGIRTPL